MTILKDTRNVITFSLPSLPSSKIEVYESFSFGQMMEIQKKQQSENLKESDPQWGLYLLNYLIKDWDLTDESGKKFPIDSEAFNLLSEKDGLFLIQKIGEIYSKSHEETDKKKTKSSKS